VVVALLLGGFRDPGRMEVTRAIVTNRKLQPAITSHAFLSRNYCVAPEVTYLSNQTESIDQTDFNLISFGGDMFFRPAPVASVGTVSRY